MLRFLYADQLSDYSVLAESMFKDRAAQFKQRLNWEVSVDSKGWEVDEYDHMNPMYVIWENADGRHGGSIRVMPTTGRIMTNEHFLHLTGGVRIASPFIWECTRFCLSPGASSQVAAGLLFGGLELGLRFGLAQAVGVVYTRTLPLYRRIGWVPDVIGSAGEGRESISVGIWDVSYEARGEISRRSGMPAALVTNWLDASLAPRPTMGCAPLQRQPAEAVAA
jgi:N-acyl-L-homoserine lactone synthetase